MLKYTTTMVGFREVPDEISLCINISNCQIKCPNCHSKELWEDIGVELSISELDRLIGLNSGITCVCFMGYGNDFIGLLSLAQHIRDKYPNLNIALYTGSKEEPQAVGLLDFVKYGPYDEKRGGLDKRTTNQRMIQWIFHPEPRIGHASTYERRDITSKFWK